MKLEIRWKDGDGILHYTHPRFDLSTLCGLWAGADALYEGKGVVTCLTCLARNPSSATSPT
jgi:hypothetical protein